MWKSQAGTLVRVLTSLSREPIELHALYPTRRSMSGKVRAFIDALIGHIDTVTLTSSTNSCLPPGERQGIDSGN
jgi:DNA-binding transcriptional LysR family regulator